MRKFQKEGHHVYIVSPLERRFKKSTMLIQKDNFNLLRVKSLNFQKTNIIEKGLGTLLIEYIYLAAVEKYFSAISFELIIYSTPPITFTKVVKRIKKRDNSISYLLLKDIFPQNALDLGIIKKHSFIHHYFRSKELEMYAVSDFIGCMSPANVEYLRKHNPEINPLIIEVNPNSVELMDKFISNEEKDIIRKQYDLPIDKPIFIYGGNLGKPQGIDFIINILDTNKENNDTFFVIIGSGIEFPKIKKWFIKNKPTNAKLLSFLPKQEYDRIVQSCNVGMIFLDNRFTIPNYPSRLLPYLEFKMPVLLATDLNTDIGLDAENNGFGFWCESGNIESFNDKIYLLSKNQELIQLMGKAGYNYLVENFTVNKSYSIIMKHLKN